jgi:hypothetical protein
MTRHCLLTGASRLIALRPLMKRLAGMAAGHVCTGQQYAVAEVTTLGTVLIDTVMICLSAAVFPIEQAAHGFPEKESTWQSAPFQWRWRSAGC